jgi:anti-anti-sigma factor
MGDSPLIDVVVGQDGVISVSGDIDMAGGPVLDAALATAETKRDDVVIDLQGVTFVDSSGLRSLLGAARRADQRGRRVALLHVGREVNRLFELTGTRAMFDLR